MSRPAGEIRAALRSAFAELGHATWRQVLPACPVNATAPAEALLVRRTVENMVRAGELVAVGNSRAAGSRIVRTLYELAPRGGAGGGDAPAPWCGTMDCLDLLQDVTRGWLEEGA
jgi:hypothetical protein